MRIGERHFLIPAIAQKRGDLTRRAQMLGQFQNSCKVFTFPAGQSFPQPCTTSCLWPPLLLFRCNSVSKHPPLPPQSVGPLNFLKNQMQCNVKCLWHFQIMFFFSNELCSRMDPGYQDLLPLSQEMRTGFQFSGQWITQPRLHSCLQMPDPAT